MKTTINAYEFTNEMTSHGFTRSGALALFNYLEDYEQDTDQELDFDPIGLRCDFTEYENLQEIAREYGDEFADIDHLRDFTQVIEFESGIIIQQF
jgi:hypothetical protein